MVTGLLQKTCLAATYKSIAKWGGGPYVYKKYNLRFEFLFFVVFYSEKIVESVHEVLIRIAFLSSEGSVSRSLADAFKNIYMGES